MNICLFEDSGFEKLLPAVYHRPVYDLLCGTSTLGEKIIDGFKPENVTLHSRNYLSKRLHELYPNFLINTAPDDSSDILFINGRLLLDPNSLNQIKSLNSGQKLLINGTVAAAKVPVKKSNELLKNDCIDSFYDLDEIQGEGTLVEFLWELIQNNGKQITLEASGNSAIPESVAVVGDGKIILGENVTIYPGCVFDTSKGPIILSNGATVKANSVLEGPLFIGEKTIINSMTRIGDATIDSVCKVGGEIHSTIMHSFSNKQHDGFLGDAYLGSWVNLGAGTNNSNLKNDYGNIQVLINGKRYDSESQFVGLLIGDHSKSGIGSLFNTGTVVGPNCNVFGGGLPPQELPAFTWGSPLKRFTTYRLEKAQRVAEIVMARRSQPFTDGEKEIFKTVYDLTASARKSL